MQELKPCPFCGGDFILIEKCWENGTVHLAVCPACGASTANFENIDEAIEAWNRRAEE